MPQRGYHESSKEYSSSSHSHPRPFSSSHNSSHSRTRSSSRGRGRWQFVKARGDCHSGLARFQYKRGQCDIIVVGITSSINRGLFGELESFRVIGCCECFCSLHLAASSNRGGETALIFWSVYWGIYRSLSIDELQVCCGGTIDQCCRCCQWTVVSGCTASTLQMVGCGIGIGINHTGYQISCIKGMNREYGYHPQRSKWIGPWPWLPGWQLWNQWWTSFLVSVSIFFLVFSVF